MNNDSRLFMFYYYGQSSKFFHYLFNYFIAGYLFNIKIYVGFGPKRVFEVKLYNPRNDLNEHQNSKAKKEKVLI